MKLTILSSLFKMDGYCPSEHGVQLKGRKDELHQVAELAGLGMKQTLCIRGCYENIDGILSTDLFHARNESSRRFLFTGRP